MRDFCVGASVKMICDVPDSPRYGEPIFGVVRLVVDCPQLEGAPFDPGTDRAQLKVVAWDASQDVLGPLEDMFTLLPDPHDRIEGLS